MTAGDGLRTVTAPVTATLGGLGRRALAGVFRGARLVAPPPRYARGMIDVDTLLNGRDLEAVQVLRSVVEEPPRVPLLLDASDPVPPLEGVRTTISLLDVTNPDFSFRNGYLVDPDRRLVAEKKVVATFPLLRVAMVPLERPETVRGTVALLSTVRNFGHWLLLTLPFVHHYRAALGGEPDYYYVGGAPTRLQIESLEMLGIRRERVVGHAVRADRLVALVPDREQGYDADFLLYPGRHLHADSSVSGSRRRVLVSRSQASHRRLLNEDECAAALRDLGVELLVTDAMSLSEEVALFRSAELVVGAHGAGLTNIVFAPEGAALVELVPSTYWDSIFAQLASVKRQRYAFLRGRTRGAHRLVPPIQHDFEVDVAAAVSAVRNALAV
jgi:hypothetical protein